MNKPELGAIFGTGRSGTTWLGSIISSHPSLVYRFEPFHRRKNTDPKVQEAINLIQSKTFSEEDIPQIYNALLPAYPEWDKPPFFAKEFPSRMVVGKFLIWSIQRKYFPNAPIFPFLYTPQNSPKLIFKEVELVNLLCNLLEKTQIPIVYIVRHPCAVIFSLMQGQKKSLMPSGRREVIKNLLAAYGTELAQRYENKVEQMSIVEQEALLWLMDVQKAVKACNHHQNGLVIFYEELVEYPQEIIQKVLNHLDLEMKEEVISFIEESTGKAPVSKHKRSEIYNNSYFSVFRDSKVSRDHWKQGMSQEDQTKVKEIVGESPIFVEGTKAGFWD